MDQTAFIVEVDGFAPQDIMPEVAGALDMVAEGDGRWHVLDKGQSYHVELVEADYPAKRYVLKINGRRFTVRIRDKYARLIESLGLTKEIVADIKEIRAPMPGLVLAIPVRPGDSFDKGDPLLILEAMKMENIIKAPRSGRVARVLVQKGDAVDKNQILIELA